jgi:hypothetical protein
LVTTPGTMHDAFPSNMRVGKGGESHRQIHASSFYFLAPKFLCLLPLCLTSPPSSRSSLSRAAMATSLLAPHFRTDRNIMQVRKMLGLHSAEYDGKVRCGAIPLIDLRRSEIILFYSYALAGLALSVSSFFLTLLEN